MKTGTLTYIAHLCTIPVMKVSKDLVAASAVPLPSNTSTAPPRRVATTLGAIRQILITTSSPAEVRKRYRELGSKSCTSDGSTAAHTSIPSLHRPPSGEWTGTSAAKPVG